MSAPFSIQYEVTLSGTTDNPNIYFEHPEFQLKSFKLCKCLNGIDALKAFLDDLTARFSMAYRIESSIERAPLVPRNAYDVLNKTAQFLVPLQYNCSDYIGRQSLMEPDCQVELDVRLLSLEWNPEFDASVKDVVITFTHRADRTRLMHFTGRSPSEAFNNVKRGFNEQFALLAAHAVANTLDAPKPFIFGNWEIDYWHDTTLNESLEFVNPIISSYEVLLATPPGQFGPLEKYTYEVEPGLSTPHTAISQTLKAWGLKLTQQHLALVQALMWKHPFDFEPHTLDRHWRAGDCIMAITEINHKTK